MWSPTLRFLDNTTTMLKGYKLRICKNILSNTERYRTPGERVPPQQHQSQITLITGYIWVLYVVLENKKGLKTYLVIFDEAMQWMGQMSYHHPLPQSFIAFCVSISFERASERLTERAVAVCERSSPGEGKRRPTETVTSCRRQLCASLEKSIAKAQVCSVRISSIGHQFLNFRSGLEVAGVESYVVVVAAGLTGWKEKLTSRNFLQRKVLCVVKSLEQIM